MLHLPKTARMLLKCHANELCADFSGYMLLEIDAAYGANGANGMCASVFKRIFFFFRSKKSAKKC